METSGIDAWFELDPASCSAMPRLTTKGHGHDGCLDGFGHGASLSVIRRDEIDSPADLYLEGSDQHRGWFQSSLLTSVAMDGRAPYRAMHDARLHGGRKGPQDVEVARQTIVFPQKVINNLGADILRLVGCGDGLQRRNESASDEILKRMADSYRRMRNTTRFLLGNLHGFDPAATRVPVDELVDLDRWAVARAARPAGLDLSPPTSAMSFHRDLPGAAQFLRRRHGRLLSRYTQGSLVHDRR